MNKYVDLYIIHQLLLKMKPCLNINNIRINLYDRIPPATSRVISLRLRSQIESFTHDHIQTVQ